jgi:ribosomal-protein-alanine N-acetyltransferase
MTLSDVRWRPPTLRTARLLLRGYEPSDATAIYAYASDPETTQYMAWDRHVSIDGAHEFLNDWVTPAYEQRQLEYALCLPQAPERVIGGVGARVISAAHRTMELGYILAREHWAQGLIPEAARAVLDHAFRTTDVERIAAPILAENARSRRAAEKMGLTLDGVLRSALELRGRRWDEAIYSILRGE